MLKEAAYAVKSARPFDNQLLLLGVQLKPGRVQRNLCRPCEALEFSEQRPVLRLGPGLDRAFVQRLALVRDHQVEVNIDRVAKALAARARPIRIVEREQARLGFVVAAAIVFALEALGKAQALGSLAAVDIPILTAGRDFKDNLARFPIADLDRIDNAGTLGSGDDQTVDEAEYRFGEIDVQQRLRSRELEDPPVLK